MRIALISLTLLLVAAPLYAKNPLDEIANTATTAEQLIALGYLNLEANRDKEAKALFKTAEMRSKDKSQARLALAQIRIKNGTLQQAKHSCRKLMKNFKKSNASNLCFGKMWLKFERSARAIEEYTAIKNQGNVQALTGLAKTYHYMNEYDKSISFYNQAIAKGAGYEAHLGLGLVWERKGKKSQAMNAIKKSVSLEPNSALAQFHLGRLLKNGKKAATHIRIALTIRSDWAEAYGTLGDSLLESDIQQSIDAYGKAINIEPNQASFHLGMGTALFRQKKYELARKELNKTLALVPSQIDATQMLADLEWATGNSSKAAELAEKSVQLSPNNPEICYNTAYLFYKMKRYTQANAYFLRAISMDPQNTASHVYMGDIACERRMYKDGIKHYQNALKTNMQAFKKSEIEKRIKKCK